MRMSQLFGKTLRQAPAEAEIPSPQLLLPIEIWQASGRDQTMKDILFRFSDKRDREFVLGPTHEEVIVELFKRHVRSYRDLPLLVYQIQQKFRDEPRPRGGLIRLRQFPMRDPYPFDTAFAGLEVSYRKMLDASPPGFE